MAVILNDSTAIEQALRMLWREANREGVIEKLKERRYYVKDSYLRHQDERKFVKTKVRRARQKRKFANKGYMA